MDKLGRRKFLRTGMAGAAGAMVLSPSFFELKGKTTQQAVITRTLGKTGLKVPVVSFGVMRADNPALCKAAYENGIVLFDTAHGYQNGNNETMLGTIFKGKPRSSFILQTKIKPAGMGRDGLPTDQTTADDFLEKFNLSLTRLQMDFVDILYIHDVSNPEFLKYKPLVSTLEKLKKLGKVRFIGFSTHNNMAGVISAAAGMATWDVILTSYNFKTENIDEMNTALRRANQAGIGIVAMKTLAGGGFLDKEKAKPINTAAALKWVLSNTDVHTAIPGMTTFDHLDANLKVLADLNMTDQEKKDLLIAGAEQGMFCTGCNNCIGKCPQNLPVPDLMRAYMYAYGYSSLPMAYNLLGELGAGSTPCINCESCSIDCTKSFNIREKITDVSRLVNVPSDFIV
jgi:uncharacterized protein